MRDTTHHQALRDWAKGTYPLEAATELLIRSFDGRFAMTSLPWINPDDYGGWYVDFERLQASAVLTGPYSGGERRVLGVAASLGDSDNKLALNDALPGIDREHGQLVMAAVSHAMGSHQQGHHPHVNEAGRLVLPAPGYIGALFPWPEEDQ